MRFDLDLLFPLIVMMLVAGVACIPFDGPWALLGVILSIVVCFTMFGGKH